MNTKHPVLSFVCRITDGFAIRVSRYYGLIVEAEKETGKTSRARGSDGVQQGASHEPPPKPR
jgi:hypothetical protein